ncbi:hypothetical protein K474DRAFT_1568550, partial [Panus rudis PR-1116 ss-1]
RLKKQWTAPIYAFFKPEVDIVEKGGRRAHRFHCFNRGCKASIVRYLDKNDARSTSNLHKHARKCWGDATVQAARETANATLAREGLEKLARNSDGSITAAFERTGKGKVTYSTTQFTRTETRAEIVRWVAENKRPFDVVKDRGFLRLMKTGRPEYWIPSPTTVSRDVKNVFVNVRRRIAKMLNEFEGELNFSCDCWTSPNHRAFAAFTVHLHVKGVPLRFLLDMVEV